MKTATTVAGWGSTRRSKFDCFLEGLDALQPLVVHAMQPLAVHAMVKRCEEYSKDSLDAEAKVRYEKKLQLIGLGTCPYKLSSEAWIDDVTLWPPVEFPEIVLYLLQTPGKYTQEKLKAYKSLEAYNYFLSNWVGTCYYHKITDSEFCVIKAAVGPRQ